MTARVWERFLTDSDRQHLAAVGEKSPFGFGSRPAVLSVDNYRGGVGDKEQGLLEAIATWPSSTGRVGWRALERVTTLFEASRSSRIPIIHVTGLPEHESGMAGWSERRRAPRTSHASAAELDRRSRRFDIVPQAAPLDGEVVLRKNSPSAFFGTPLASHLLGQGIDTLIVCGQSTSGCIRASVVDARSYRLRVVVVEDCVYDRHEATAAMNLFDMHQKYADVLCLDEVLDWMKSLEPQPGP